MSMNLRNWVRKHGLVRWINPLVLWLEGRRTAGICNYQVEVVPPEVLIRFDGRQVSLPSSHAHFLSLARSEHERPTMAVFLKYLQPGEIVWDIGANAGFYSWLASKLVGAEGKVFSFEPNPQNFQLLSENVALLMLQNCKPLQLAIADCEGEAQMEKADRLCPESSLILGGNPAPANAITVAVTSGDALVRKGESPAPDFIKLDVEGYEGEVLRGMTTVLASPRCRKVFCEVHFAMLSKRGLDDAVKEMKALLRKSGFNELRWVSRSHLLALKN